MDFACQRDVALLGCSKLPVHLEIVHEILPTIAETDVTDRAARKACGARHDKVNVLALSADKLTLSWRAPQAFLAARSVTSVSAMVGRISWTISKWTGSFEQPRRATSR